MLKRLTIKNYILIEDVTLFFDEGLSVITGETGAGKSILLSALGSTLGDRGFSQNIAPNKSFMEVISSFDISHNEEAKAFLRENRLEALDGVVTIQRQFFANENLSRCLVNGKVCGVAKVKNLSETLIDIHNQNDNHILFQPDSQLDLLDRLCTHAPLLEQYDALYKRYVQKKEALELLVTEGEAIKKQRDFLAYTALELEKLDLTEEEYEHYKVLVQELESRKELELSKSNLLDHLNAINSLFDKSIDELEKMEKQDQRYEALRGELYEHREISREFYRNLLSQKDQEISDFQIDAINQKIAVVQSLMRKYDKSIGELLLLKEETQNKLLFLKEGNFDVENTQLELQKYYDEALSVALQLNENRKRTSVELSKNVKQAIARLHMEEGDFGVDVQESKDEDGKFILGRKGITDIQFLYRSTEKHPFKRLKQVASGGELSRLSLAIKKTFSGLLSPITLIFDEIDTGIGGETAISVGESIREISKRHQTIVITHLAQIARYARGHFKVYKEKKGSEIKTLITRLNDEQRVREIARMMFGEEQSKENLLASREFLSGGDISL